MTEQNFRDLFWNGLLLAQIILIILKLIGVIAVGWNIVFIPLFIMVFVCLLGASMIS